MPARAAVALLAALCGCRSTLGHDLDTATLVQRGAATLVQRGATGADFPWPWNFNYSRVNGRLVVTRKNATVTAARGMVNLAENSTATAAIQAEAEEEGKATDQAKHPAVEVEAAPQKADEAKNAAEVEAAPQKADEAKNAVEVEAAPQKADEAKNAVEVEAAPQKADEAKNAAVQAKHAAVEAAPKKADEAKNAAVKAAPKKADQAKHAAVEAKHAAVGAAPKKASEDSSTKDDTISVKLIDTDGNTRLIKAHKGSRGKMLIRTACSMAQMSSDGCGDNMKLILNDKRVIRPKDTLAELGLVDDDVLRMTTSG